MARLLLLVAFALLTGCESFPHTAYVMLAVVRPLSPTYLRYRVASPRRAWTREVVLDRDRFTELRTTGGRTYALGLADGRAWMQVGARPPVEIDGPLAADERTEAAWVGLRYGAPEAGATSELETCHADVCTVVYTPPDGHVLWVDVDRGTRRPTALAWVAQHDAVESCDELRWDERDGATVVASARCSAIVDEVGRETTTWTLEERQSEPAPPAWAQVQGDDILPLRPLREPVVFPIDDPSSRVIVFAAAAGGAALPLVLDTGSPVTILSRRFLDALGVVPAPEPPMHARPPFLPPDTYDAAIVDRLVLGDLELHGVRVLVPRREATFEGDEAGLLGMDLLSRFVVDVDGPARTLRVGPRDRFVPDDSMVALPFWGASHGRVVVAGAVDELGEVPLIVDTGAPVNVLVGGPAMHARHPRRAGDDVRLGEGGGAYDYAADIEGFHLGPFGFPSMPAMGHDRRPDLSFLDDDSALVGLGVLRHFRMIVDAAQEVVYLVPGASYAVLTTRGLELEDRGGAATVARVVEGEHEWKQPVRVGDVVRGVGGRAVRGRDEALEALAEAQGPVRVALERRGNRLVRTLGAR